MHEPDEMRNMILADIIDKMHGRMADKMFPPDPAKADMPAVDAVPSEAGSAEMAVSDADMPRSEDDTEMSDEDMEEMLKNC